MFDVSKIRMTTDNEGTFLVLDGKRIAKSHKREWVSLLPGYAVYDDLNQGFVITPLRSAPSKRPGRGRTTRR